MRNFTFRTLVVSGDFSVSGSDSPRVRSSIVTVMVEATVLVRKLRRLQPVVPFVEEVISGAPFALFGMQRSRESYGPSQGTPLRLREFLSSHQFALYGTLRAQRRNGNERFQTFARARRKACARKHRGRARAGQAQGRRSRHEFRR